MPPDAEVDDAMQAELWEKKLAFVNEQSGVHRVCFHGVDNLVEGHDHGFEIGVEEFKGEICGGFQPGTATRLPPSSSLRSGFEATTMGP